MTAVRRIPDPPQGYLPFVSGDQIHMGGAGARGYRHLVHARLLLVYAQGGWYPVTFIQKINRRSVDLSYATGSDPRHKHGQRVTPERIAGPATVLDVTAANLRDGDRIVDGPVPEELFGPILTARTGMAADHSPRVDFVVATPDGPERVRRMPDAGPFRVLRIRQDVAQ